MMPDTSVDVAAAAGGGACSWNAVTNTATATAVASSLSLDTDIPLVRLGPRFRRRAQVFLPLGRAALTAGDGLRCRAGARAWLDLTRWAGRVERERQVPAPSVRPGFSGRRDLTPHCTPFPQRFTAMRRRCIQPTHGQRDRRRAVGESGSSVHGLRACQLPAPPPAKVLRRVSRVLRPCNEDDPV